jgi:hypothetical protein
MEVTSNLRIWEPTIHPQDRFYLEEFIVEIPCPKSASASVRKNAQLELNGQRGTKQFTPNDFWGKDSEWTPIILESNYKS